MPYYKEGKVDNWSVSRYYDGTGTVQTTPFLHSVTEMQGYRSRGPRLPYFDLVPDHLADPYAYFLNQSRDRKFDSALKARGLASWILPVDTGHNFFLRKTEWIGKPLEAYIRRNGVTTGISGGVLQTLGFLEQGTWNGQTWPTPPTDYSNVAQQMYASAAPTSEVFDLANFVGELREGLPSIVPSLLRGKINGFRAAGSDYLNVQFGWIPFLTDLQNAGLALKTATEALARPSNITRRSRRRKPILTSTEASTTTAQLRTFFTSGPSWMAQQIDHPVGSTGSGVVNYPMYSIGNSMRGDHYWSRSTNVERWFDSEFVQLPKIGFDPDDYFSRLDQLLNLKLTPETLWNLAPWSWLVDWHFRIGDSIAANLLAADDRVNSVYAYAMQKTTESIFTAHRIDSVSGTGAVYIGPREWGGVHRTTVKQRVRANPYGFTAGGADGLNESQIAILAALGLTKAGR